MRWNAASDVARKDPNSWNSPSAALSPSVDWADGLASGDVNMAEVGQLLCDPDTKHGCPLRTHQARPAATRSR